MVVVHISAPSLRKPSIPSMEIRSALPCQDHMVAESWEVHIVLDGKLTNRYKSIGRS